MIIGSVNKSVDSRKERPKWPPTGNKSSRLFDTCATALMIKVVPTTYGGDSNSICNKDGWNEGAEADTYHTHHYLLYLSCLFGAK